MAVTVIGSGGGTEYLPLTGGTLTGDLQIGETSPTTSGGKAKSFEILNKRTLADGTVVGSDGLIRVIGSEARMMLSSNSQSSTSNYLLLRATTTGAFATLSSLTGNSTLIIGRGDSVASEGLRLIADRNGQNYIYNLSVDNDPTCAATKGYVDGRTPSGAIMLFYTGAGADIPAGFKKCDGTNGTPNLSAPTGCIYIMRE